MLLLLQASFICSLLSLSLQSIFSIRKSSLTESVATDMGGPIPTHVAHPTNEDVAVPISKLPNEILLDIFMLIVENYRKETPFFLTQVCRHWKAVAVGAPLLWVKPRTPNYECVKIMLERSDPADLDVVLESQMPMRTVQAIIDCMWRFGSLQIYLRKENPPIATTADAHVDVLDNNHVMPWTGPLILRELRHGPRCLKALTVRSFPSSDVNLLLQHLQPMDQLQHLSLTNTAFEWNILPLRSLAQLHIYLGTVSSTISTEQLVGILGQMPLLEIISIGQLDRILSRPFSASAIFSQSSKATLPLLRYLRLQESTLDFALYFLTHMDLPQLHHLAIGIEVDEPFSDNVIFHDSIYTPLMLALTTTITTGKFGVFNYLRLRTRSFHLETFSVDDLRPTYRGDDGPFGPPVISIRYGRRFWNETRTGGRLVSAMLLEDLIRLTCTPSMARITCMNIDDNISVATFELLLRTPCCSSLENLMIRDPGQYMPALTLLLAVTLPRNTEDAPLIPFLELRRIHFYFARLKDVTPTVWDAFCDCLALRKSVGQSLDEMCVDACSITSEQISSLENAVTTCTRKRIDLVDS